MALVTVPNERIKVLQNVTVAALEKALTDGFMQCGHRNLSVFVPALEGMNWKTSISSHAQAFVALVEILFSLLTVCHNGLIPDSLLTKAT